MITNYSSLVQFVTDHLELDDETAAQIPTFIGLAEATLRRMLTVPEREERTSLSTVAGQSYVALPATVRQIRTVNFNEDYPLSPVPLNVLMAYSASPGAPQVYCIADGSLFLSPVPDGVYPLDVTYLATLPALTATAPTNWLLSSNPDAYLYAVLIQAEAFRANDARLPVLTAALEGVIDQMNREGNRYRNAAPMRLRSPVVV